MGRRARIRIHCRRRSDLVLLLTLALLTAAIPGALFLSDGRAGASPSGEPQQLAVSPRRYYLTSSAVAADQALTACATGYHTAALWEIIDTTNLRYNGTLGYTRLDSGSGPPTGAYGWVRTGYSGNTSAMPGRGNCNAWATASGGYSGTRARLPVDWTAAAELTVPWETVAEVCSDISTRVWCVGDYVIDQEIYFPNVVKSY